MGDDRNARRSAQLGMSFGKATQILRKMIMFRLVQETSRDKCFKCGLLIATIEELSIEHKLPWQGRDTARFWDLDNIAFSHLRCNLPEDRRLGPAVAASAARRRATSQQMMDQNLAWCSGHGGYINRSLFTLDRAKYNGVQDICRECRKTYRNGAVAE